MSKIYLSDKYKKIILNTQIEHNTQQIIFEKKYMTVHRYLVKNYIFPNVLAAIIIDYLNEAYTVEYTIDWCGMYITQITNIYGTKLLNHANTFVSVCIGNASNEALIKRPIIINEMNVFITHEDKLITQTTCYYTYTLLDFINYFMDMYYNKQNYINHHECVTNMNDKIMQYREFFKDGHQYIYVTRNIKNYRELRHLCVIFKILCKLIYKKNLTSIYKSI